MRPPPQSIGYWCAIDFLIMRFQGCRVADGAVPRAAAPRCQRSADLGVANREWRSDQPCLSISAERFISRSRVIARFAST